MTLSLQHAESISAVLLVQPTDGWRVLFQSKIRKRSLQVLLCYFLKKSSLWLAKNQKEY